jgi:signal transduction histidine kinase
VGAPIAVLAAAHLAPDELPQLLAQLDDDGRAALLLLERAEELSGLSSRLHLVDDFVVAPRGAPVDAAQLQARLELLLHRVRVQREQLAAARAVVRAQQTKQALLDALPDSILRIGADGTLLDYRMAQPLPVAGWGPHLLGKRGDELRALLTDLPEELLAGFGRVLRRALAEPSVQTLEYTLGEARERRHYEARLRALSADEVVAIIRDVTSKKRAEEELRHYAEAKERFASQLIALQEGERQRIAHELHDAIGQMLLVHKLDLELVSKQSDLTQIRAMVDTVCNGLDDTLEMVRSLARGLRPPLLDDFGLSTALESLVREFDRRSPVRCTSAIDPSLADIRDQTATTLYRIAQEALSNALRHASCASISVTLQRRDGGIELRVEDDGVGIRLGQVDLSRSSGLIGMRERAALIGGTVTIFPGARGTVVCALVPLSRTRVARPTGQTDVEVT